VNIDAAPEAVPAAMPASESEAPSGEVSVVRATGVIALGNIASRVLGLARETLLSDLFGAGAAVDAFQVAVIVPRTLYDLLIGGHVNSALVPVLSEYAVRGGRAALWQLVSLLLGVATTILALLVLMLEMLAPQVIALVSGGASAEAQALAADLLRITAPALFFLGLFAVLSGLLYALRRFTLPAFAGAVFNGCIVLVALLVAPTLGITAMALGWLVGAVVQMGMQFVGLRDARLWPTLRGAWSNPGLRRIGLLYLPVLFSLVIDTLVIRVVSYHLASQAGEASISYMSYATTLIQFPHGLVATAISLAILPTLSRQAALITAEGDKSYKHTLGRGLRLAVVLILPATVGLFVLATPVVRLIFEHGSFTPVDTAITSLALQLYLFGLPFAAVDLLLVFAFYARQDTVMPALVGVISLGAYMAVALGLMPRYGLFSLMIADSVKHMLHAGISGWLLGRQTGGLHGQRLVPTVLKAGVAALAMGLMVYIGERAVAALIPPASLVGELILVGGAGMIGAVTFLALAALLRVEELSWLWGIVRERLGHS